MSCTAARILMFIGFFLLVGVLLDSPGIEAKSPDMSSTILGIYRFLEDQPSGFKPTEQAEILLCIERSGTLYISAQKPGEVLSSYGTYKMKRHLISLKFPELEKSADKQVWTLTNDILTLPLQFIGSGPGTSTWQKLSPGDGPIAYFFKMVDQSLKSGMALENAVLQAAQAARQHSLAKKARDASKTAIVAYEIWEQGRSCAFKFENGQEEIALVVIPSHKKRKSKTLSTEPLLPDPQKHVPPRSKSWPDDPKNRTAVIFAPFQDMPYSPIDLGEDRLKSTVSSTETLHADLDFIGKQLRSGHYQITVLLNENATMEALQEACVKNSTPGLLYLKSHGDGDIKNGSILATGQKIADAADEDHVHNLNWLAKMKLEKYDGPALQKKMTYTPLWFQQFCNFPVCFIGVRDSFFRRLTEELGSDFSTSFVYIEGSHSATSPAMRWALKARQFLGYRNLAIPNPSRLQTNYLFALLAKPTYSVREVLGMMRSVVEHQKSLFYPEDQWLANVEKGDNDSLALYGSEMAACELPNLRVLHLCWMARWNSPNPAVGCRALQHAYREVWSKGKFPRFKYTLPGLPGHHVPSREETEFAQHLVCGIPKWPGGRFTLNDSNPVRGKAPE